MQHSTNRKTVYEDNSRERHKLCNMLFILPGLLDM